MSFERNSLSTDGDFDTDGDLFDSTFESNASSTECDLDRDGCFDAALFGDSTGDDDRFLDRDRDRLDLFDFDEDFFVLDLDLCLGDFFFDFECECFFNLCLDGDLLCDFLRFAGDLLTKLLCFFDRDGDFLVLFNFDCDLLLDLCFWDFILDGDALESEGSFAFETEWPFDFDLDRLREIDFDFERDLLFDSDLDRDLFFPLDFDLQAERDSLSREGEGGRGCLVRWGERLRDFCLLLGDFDKDL